MTLLLPHTCNLYNNSTVQITCCINTCGGLMMNEALLLVDIQNDYFEGGNMELHQPEKAAQKAKEILKVFRKKHKTVIHVQHIANNEGPTFFLPETVGVQIHDDVQPIANEKSYKNITLTVF